MKESQLSIQQPQGRRRTMCQSAPIGRAKLEVDRKIAAAWWKTEKEQSAGVWG
jgi:hypothetical protein